MAPTTLRSRLMKTLLSRRPRIELNLWPEVVTALLLLVVAPPFLVDRVRVDAAVAIAVRGAVLALDRDDLEGVRPRGVRLGLHGGHRPRARDLRQPVQVVLRGQHADRPQVPRAA